MDPEYDVPADAVPAATCSHCGRPFTAERYRTLHLGRAHADHVDEATRERIAAVRDTESTDLFTFHVKAAVSVFLVYFLFTFLYALVWSG